MNFDLSEEQELFTSTVERFTAPIDVEARHRLRGLETGYSPARWAELAELGLIALAVGEEQGGMGGSLLDLALVGEALGKGNAPDPWIENGVLAAKLLAAGGASEALESVIAGESVVAIAWAERSRRYNWVDRDGLELRQYRLADGSIAGELYLRCVAVSDADRLAIGEAALAGITAQMRVLASAELLGLGQRLLDDTLTYVKEREQFGVPIGSFQALQHRLVDCYAKIEQARSMLYRTALMSEGLLEAAAGAKAFITQCADHVAREAVQMHGGMGITDELAIGHAMKRVIVLSRLFGDVSTNLDDYAKAA